MLTRSLLGAVVVAMFAAALVAAAPAAHADPFVNAARPPGGSFVGASPVRVLDSRAASPPATSFVVHPFDGLPGVLPTDAAAVLLNVTVVGATRPGYVVVGAPNGGSNGNFVAAAPSATLALASTFGDDLVVIATSVPAQVVVDVQGYVTSPDAATTSTFTPLSAPTRIADTRRGLGLTPFRGAATQRLAVAGSNGIPADATAVIANLTVAGATSSTYLTAWSGDGVRPTVSAVNAGARQIVANRALVPLDARGRLAIANAAGVTDVVVDVVGYLAPDPAGSYYTPVPSSRLTDTVAEAPLVYPTVDPGLGGAAVRAPSARDLAPTTAVWLTLVGDHPAGRGYLAAGPFTDGSTPPGTSDLNLVPGRAVANAGPVRVSGSGVVQVFARPRTRIVADLSGWFRRSPSHVAPGVWTGSRYPDDSTTPLRRDTGSPALPEWFARGVFTGTGSVTPVRGFAVAPDSTVWTSTFSHVGPGYVPQWSLPTRIGGLTGIVQLATAGDLFDAAVYARDGQGRVWGFGANDDGQLGSAPTDGVPSPPVPTVVPLPQAARTVGAAPGIGYAVLDNGTLWSWGRADALQLGRAATAQPWRPARVRALRSVVAVAGDGSLTFAVDADGITTSWGISQLDGYREPTPTRLNSACSSAASLFADITGVWELCADHTVQQLSEHGGHEGGNVPVTGAVAIASAPYDYDGVRVLLRDGRVVDARGAEARYEAGWTGVTALAGTPGAQLTLVGG